MQKGARKRRNNAELLKNGIEKIYPILVHIFSRCINGEKITENGEGILTYFRSTDENNNRESFHKNKI